MSYIARATMTALLLDIWHHSTKLTNNSWMVQSTYNHDFLVAHWQSPDILCSRTTVRFPLFLSSNPHNLFVCKFFFLDIKWKKITKLNSLLQYFILFVYISVYPSKNKSKLQVELNRRPYAWKGRMLTNELHRSCNYDCTTTRYLTLQH